MTSKVLIVDDDANLLSALRRQFHRELTLEVAVGPEEGITAVRERGPFAVVVSDMQMPEMTGVEFLSRVAAECRDTVRIMLTGNADQKTAVDAVNDGCIFRFLNKPCSKEDLTKAIDAGIEQHRLITAERDLVTKTLTGSVKVLADVLALAHPKAFSAATRVRAIVSKLARELDAPNVWECELAASLCRLGYVAIPDDTIDKLTRRAPLSDAERGAVQSHPSTARKLIENIPRLERVARIVGSQLEDFATSSEAANGGATIEAGVALGAHILRTACDFVELCDQGAEPAVALRTMLIQKRAYDPRVLAALSKTQELASRPAPVPLVVADLRVGMTLAQHLMAEDGSLLAPAGAEVSESLLTRIRQFHRHRPVREPVWALVEGAESRIAAEAPTPAVA